MPRYPELVPSVAAALLIRADPTHVVGGVLGVDRLLALLIQSFERASGNVRTTI